MSIMTKILSVLELLILSLFTYLKALPFLLIVYFIPAVMLMLFALPYMPNSWPLTSGLAELSRPEFINTAKVLLASKYIVITSLLFISLCFYCTIFSFFLTEGIVNREKRGLLIIFAESFPAVGRFLFAYLAYAGIIVLFTIVPLLPFRFFTLQPWAQISLWGLWILCVIATVAFVFTSVFFTRVAVLRDKWPQDIFYYSYKIVMARPFKMIVFLISIAMFTAISSTFVKMFLNIPLGILSSVANINSVAATMPFYIICMGLLSFFPIIAVTVYFLNIDYNINSERNRVDLYSRVSAINDKSMPRLR